MSGIRIFNTAVNQLQNSQRNLMAISEARRKIEADEEDRAFRKKEQEFKLERMKRDGNISELQYDILQNQFKQYEKQEKDKQLGKVALIKEAEHKNKTAADAALNWAKIGFKSDPQGVTNFLSAVKANQERATELQPGTFYGKPTIKTVDVKAEKAKQEAKGPSINDIYRVARDLAKDDDSDVPMPDKIRKYMGDARNILMDEAPESAPVQKGRVEEAIPKQDEVVKPEPLPRSTLRLEKTPLKQQLGKVKVKSPDGTIGYLPKENAEKARQRGFTFL